MRDVTRSVRICAAVVILVTAAACGGKADQQKIQAGIDSLTTTFDSTNRALDTAHVVTMDTTNLTKAQKESALTKTAKSP